jgi:hypothetical protein
MQPMQYCRRGHCYIFLLQYSVANPLSIAFHICISSLARSAQHGSAPVDAVHEICPVKMYKREKNWRYES